MEFSELHRRYREGAESYVDVIGLVFDLWKDRIGDWEKMKGKAIKTYTRPLRAAGRKYRAYYWALSFFGDEYFSNECMDMVKQIDSRIGFAARKIDEIITPIMREGEKRSISDGSVKSKIKECIETAYSGIESVFLLGPRKYQAIGQKISDGRLKLLYKPQTVEASITAFENKLRRREEKRAKRCSLDPVSATCREQENGQSIIPHKYINRLSDNGRLRVSYFVQDVLAQANGGAEDIFRAVRESKWYKSLAIPETDDRTIYNLFDDIWIEVCSGKKIDRDSIYRIINSNGYSP